MPNHLASDLRSAARMLAGRPGFTAVAVLTLALGIGANTAIFSVVHAVLLRPLPYRDPDRLVRAVNVVQEADFELTAGADFLDWRDQSRLLDAVAAYDTSAVTLQGDGERERIQAARVSANFLSVLGVGLAQGRGFLAQEEKLNGGPAALATDRFWTRRFGKDAVLKGQTVRLDDRVYPIVGVLPPGFQVPRAPEAEILLPLALDETVERARQQMTIVTVVGRLKPGLPLREPAPAADLRSVGRLRPAPDRAVGRA